MARPGRPERNRAAQSFRQLRRFHHVINSDKVFGTHSGSRGALDLRPTIEQGTNWPLNLVPVYNFLSGQILASLGRGFYLFTSTLRGLLADRNLALASCYVSKAAIESRRS